MIAERLMLLAAGRPNVFGILFVILLIPLVAIALVRLMFVRRERNRTARLQEIAEKLGFDFQSKGDDDFFADLEAAGLSLIGNRRRRKLVNLMRGKSRSILVAIFDYSYVVQSGEHSNVARQTVVSLQSSALELPAFVLAPKTIFHRIGSLFKSQSIEIDGHPVFAKNYLLRGDDAGSIGRMFNDSVLEFFEQNQSWQMEGTGQTLVLYRPAKRLPTDEVPGLLESGLTVLGRMRG